MASLLLFCPYCGHSFVADVPNGLPFYTDCSSCASTMTVKVQVYKKREAPARVRERLTHTVSWLVEDAQKSEAKQMWGLAIVQWEHAAKAARQLGDRKRAAEYQQRSSLIDITDGPPAGAPSAPQGGPP